MKQYANINIPVPQDILLSLRLNDEEFAVQMKTLTSLMLYESGKLSIGQAAAFSDMDESDFIKFLGKHNVSVFGTITDIAEDFVNA